MNAKFFKGLLAAVISIIATTISVEGAGVAFYVTSILAGVIIYFAQNYFVKPVSVFGTIDLTDIIKGALFSIGTAIGTYAASVVTATAVDWPALWSVVMSAFVAYLSKNLFSNSKGVIGTEPK